MLTAEGVDRECKLTAESLSFVLMVVSCAGTINGGEEILAKTDSVGLQGQQAWEESPKSPNTSWHEDGLGRRT